MLSPWVQWLGKEVFIMYIFIGVHKEMRLDVGVILQKGKTVKKQLDKGKEFGAWNADSRCSLLH